MAGDALNGPPHIARVPYIAPRLARFTDRRCRERLEPSLCGDTLAGGVVTGCLTSGYTFLPASSLSASAYATGRNPSSQSVYNTPIPDNVLRVLLADLSRSIDHSPAMLNFFSETKGRRLYYTINLVAGLAIFL